jgi:hypothetical protein
MVFDGKRMRKPIQRKTVDFNCPMVEYMQVFDTTITTTTTTSNNQQLLIHMNNIH